MGISKFKLLTMIIIYDMVLLIGTYDTFEAISRLISMKYHRDFLHNKISCNYMSLRKDSFDLVQSAIYIINSFKNDVSESVPICVCSSDKFNDVCDYNYFVLYEPTKSLHEDFAKIISDINCKDNNKESKKVLKMPKK